MCAHRYISPQTGQKALFVPSTTARKSCCCRCMSVCVCVCTAHLCKCMLACVCVWNITALTGTAPRRCNWLSERGKQDCSHVEGSWRLTFRNVDRRNGRVSASGTSLHWLSSDCSFDTGAVIFTFFFFFLFGGQSWRGTIIRSNLQYPHYTYGALCREDTFLKDHWVPCVIRVIHVSPSDKAGQCLLSAAVHSVPLEVWLPHMCRGESKTPAESF